MKAKEMFEKLGYEQIKLNKYGAIYYKFVPALDKDNLSGIDWENTIKIEHKYIISNKFISLELLQAINKQVEELGWNER